VPRSIAGFTLAMLILGPGMQSQPVETPFSRLAERLDAGTRIRITVTKRRIEGSVGRADREGLTLVTGGTQESYACAQIDRVERRGDSVWTGAAVGGALIALPAWNGCQNKGRNLTCVAAGIGMFAALGALIDRAHVGWTTIYTAAPGSCGAP
jgi:hypothetical protein